MDEITHFRGDHSYLSNFYEHPMIYRGKEYATAEHAYQAAKAIDPADQELIRLQKTPGGAKRQGKRVKMRPHWDQDKVYVMYDILKHKFSDPTLKQWLLHTYPSTLIEGNNWGDMFWGVDLKTWQELNWLGKLLMIIRDYEHFEKSLHKHLQD